MAEEDEVVAAYDKVVAEEDEGVADEDQRMVVASNHRHSTYIVPERKVMFRQNPNIEIPGPDLACKNSIL